MDLTCLPGLDNICNPRDVIREAEELAASLAPTELSSGQRHHRRHSPIMAVCRPGEKLILPRNAHKSAISGLIISGRNRFTLNRRLTRTSAFPWV